VKKLPLFVIALGIYTLTGSTLPRYLFLDVFTMCPFTDETLFQLSLFVPIHSTITETFASSRAILLLL
jgi:hypothetical protein